MRRSRSAACGLTLILASCGRTDLAPGLVAWQTDSAASAASSEAGAADDGAYPQSDAQVETAEPDAHVQAVEPDARVQTAEADSEVVRFVVLGDGGTGDENQWRVARAVRAVCLRNGCDFALYLGDNIYEVGVEGVDDEQFQSKFEQPFAELDFPFYVVLGNHDYGSDVPSSSTFEPAKVTAQIEYTAHSAKWNMPGRFYTFELGPAAFFALDTGAFVYDTRSSAAAQQAWLDRALAESSAPWKIVFGHHPYISSGYHGKAGNYEGTRGTPSAIYPTGAELAELVEHSICGRAQVHFAGHDHHREWLEPVCGTHFIISGAAGKLRPLSAREDERSVFVDDQKHGFLWVELHREHFTGMFYDDQGRLDYRRTLWRDRI